MSLNVFIVTAVRDVGCRTLQDVLLTIYRLTRLRLTLLWLDILLVLLLTLLWLRTRRRFVVLIPANLDLPECIEDAFPNTVILLLSTTFLL